MALASCARNPQSVDRLAVVPFENLTSSPELDSAGRGAATAVVYDLAGAPDLYAEAVPSMNGAYDMHASRALEGYFSESGGRLELRATLAEVPGSKVIESIALLGAASDGVLPLANQLAARVSPKARALEAKAPEAFRAYAKALNAGDRLTAIGELETAAKADPKFAAASLDWARLLAGEGQRERAGELIRTALGAGPDAIDRARLESFGASINGGGKREEQALRDLARATPSDARVFRELAEFELRRRNYSGAAQDYEKAAQLNPEEPRGWNELGYALAYAEDLAGARRALDHYGRVLPQKDANALDSQGEVSFYLGDFAEAEKRFLEAQQQNGSEFRGAELEKAAEAELMADHLKEADALVQKYAAGIQDARHFRAAYQLAQWEFLTGRRKLAMEGLERILPALDRDARSLALCQLSIWRLETGDAKTAAELAAQAAELAESARARNLSAVCKAITMPGAGAASRIGAAYALLFAGKFAEATPLLESLYQDTNPLQDGQIRTLLGWAYVETGRAKEASGLLRIYPLPLSAGEPMFASMIFPRYLFLRGAALEKQGKRAEAKRSYELYLKYSGDVADASGDQAAARKSLAGM